MYVAQFAGSLIAMFAVHRRLQHYVQDEKTCWFILHTLANLCIAAATLPAFAAAGRRPDWIGFLPAEAPAPPMWDTALIGALHLYHMLAFAMDKDDWFHHLLFIPFNQLAMLAPMHWGYARWGPCIRMQHFFACGLPGAVDYGALALRRLGWLSVERQKRLQCKLNLWLRCPGVLMTIAILALECLRTGQPPLLCGLVLVDALLIGFNSLYYTERVIRSEARLRR